MTATDFIIAGGAGLLGGAMNALAGGGTFATMPTLIALGLPSTDANGTSNVALQPGAIVSAWAYRAGLEPLGGMSVRALAAISFLGGVVGAVLLVVTPARTFDLIIPWLLAAFVALAFGQRGADWLARKVSIGRHGLMSLQLLLGIYGGYFGGGVGLMMTAAWELLAGKLPHHVAAPRTLMLAMANAAAAVVFVTSGLVAWTLCVPMSLGATIGGWTGARLALRLPPGTIRGFTLLITAATTLLFFVRAYR